MTLPVDPANGVENLAKGTTLGSRPSFESGSEVRLGSETGNGNIAVKSPIAPHSRRKLIAGGVAGSLLMTVASRPVWAGGNMCTPSALASANLSGQHTFTGCGISAGWWKNKTERWPASVPSGSLFSTIFASVTYTNKVLYERKTLLEVIRFDANDHDNNPKNLGFHLVAAYLNAVQFPSQGGRPGYAFTATQVKNAYSAIDALGSDADKKTAFLTLKNTLEAANDKYDAFTAKP